MRVLSQFQLEAPLVETMRAADPALDLLIASSFEEKLAAAPRAEVIFSAYDGENPGPLGEILKKAERLRWIHTSSAGVDLLLFPELKRPGVVFTCAKGEVAGPILAEHAMALLLAITRNIALAVKAGRWDRRGKPGRSVTELHGKTMGIFGFGGTGQALARMALGFRMEVLALKRSAGHSSVEGVPEVWGQERLPELLARSDALALCAPGTPETRNRISWDEFKLMKPSAILINVGRGDIVNEAALLDALQNGRIAAAGLDVLATEPVPDDSPLWKMDNVVLTPHIAGHSPYRNARNRKFFVENFCRFVRGEPLVGVVQVELGY